MRIELNISFMWFNHLFSKHLFSWAGVILGAVHMLMKKSVDSCPVSLGAFYLAWEENYKGNYNCVIHIGDSD